MTTEIRTPAPISSLVRQMLNNALGSRVRLFYRTRGYMHGDVPLTVWGRDHYSNAHETVVSNALCRILHVGSTHVVIQPDKHPRPLAVVIADVERVDSPLVSIDAGRAFLG